jgi:hypothetical protein
MTSYIPLAARMLAFSLNSYLAASIQTHAHVGLRDRALRREFAPRENFVRGKTGKEEICEGKNRQREY